MAATWPLTDGVVTLRAPNDADRDQLVRARDAVMVRWLGPGDPHPDPTAVFVVDGELVGWGDADPVGRAPGEVNLGYALLGAHRGRGYATRGVQLLMHHLSLTGAATEVVARVDEANEFSCALLTRAHFVPQGSRDAQVVFRREVPPQIYADEIVAIRPLEQSDLDADLAAKDAEQMRWLWPHEHVEIWENMTGAQQREHARAGLEARRADFGHGPKWCFAVDAGLERYVAYVDCDLSNTNAPLGEANIAYSAHPDHRGRGYVARAVRLVVRFLRDNTAARVAFLVIDADNEPSLRVARAVGARVVEHRRSEEGDELIVHAIDLRP